MTAALLAINDWYLFSYTDNGGVLTSWPTRHGSDGSTSAYFAPKNLSSQEGRQIWQFYPSPSNSSLYIIRPQIFGGEAWLNVDETAKPQIANTTGPGSLWSVGKWDSEGRVYLYCETYGMRLFLAVNAQGQGAGTWLGMASPNTAQKSQLVYKYEPFDTIDNSTYSTLPTPWSSYFASSTVSSSSPSASSAAASTTASSFTSTTILPASSTNTLPIASPTATMTVPPIPESAANSSNRINVGAAAGGAIGGAAALILLGILGVWRYRRKQKRARSTQDSVSSGDPYMIDPRHQHRLYDFRPAEMPTTIDVELSSTRSKGRPYRDNVVELPTNTNVTSPQLPPEFFELGSHPK